jgi:hypothetical protein
MDLSSSSELRLTTCHPLKVTSHEACTKTHGSSFPEPYNICFHLITLNILNRVQNERVGTSLSLELLPPCALMHWLADVLAQLLRWRDTFVSLLPGSPKFFIKGPFFPPMLKE